MCVTDLQSILLPITFSGIAYLCLEDLILEVYPYVTGKALNHWHGNELMIEQLGQKIALVHQRLSADNLDLDSLKLMPESFLQLSAQIDTAEAMLWQSNATETH